MCLPLIAVQHRKPTTTHTHRYQRKSHSDTKHNYNKNKQPIDSRNATNIVS